MNKQPVLVKLTERERETIAQELLVLANDEIANSNAIFEAYSTDPYTRAAAEQLKASSLAIKFQEYCDEHGYCIITGTMLFTRSVVSRAILNSAYLATHLSITNISPAEFTHAMIKLEVPVDQLKAANIFMSPEPGVYNMMQLGEVYRLEDVSEETTEEQHVTEEEITKPEVTE